MIASYRKKPVVIDAVQLTDDTDWEAVADWCAGTLRNFQDTLGGEPETLLTINTLEGDMVARLDDWIIRGVQGEFYPVRGSIFTETYEPAEEAA